jgi:hypothetical protein
MTLFGPYIPLAIRKPPEFVLNIPDYYKFQVVLPNPLKYIRLDFTIPPIKLPISNKYKAKRQRRLDYYSRSRRVKRRKKLLKRKEQ